jgi:hypothetical protein
MSAIAPLTGYKVGNNDLNTLFAKYVSGVQATVSGYKDGTADLNTIFAKRIDAGPAVTGYKVGTNDLNNIFQKYSNILTNGDFAGTGSGSSIVANGWTFINASANTSVGNAITNDPEYPLYRTDSNTTEFKTGIVGAYVTINQTVTTVSGRAYTFSFWLLMGGPTSSAGQILSCTASIGGGTPKLSTTTSNTSYVFYSYPYTANSTSTVISFVCRQDPSYLRITHVRLTYP